MCSVSGPKVRHCDSGGLVQDVHAADHSQPDGGGLHHLQVHRQEQPRGN